MLWLLVVVIAIGVCVLHWVLTSSESERLYRKIPGPKGYPFLGNTLDLMRDQVSTFYTQRRWANLYKDIFIISVPTVRMINLTNPVDIETILSTSKYNEKSLLYTFLKPWLHEGLLLSNGKKWQTRRKILTPAFHFNILRHFSHILEENSWRMVRDLETQLEEPVNVVSLVSDFTLRSICETAMGTKIDEERSGSGVRYKNAIHEFGQILIQRLTKVWLMFDPIFYLTATGRKQKKILGSLNTFPKQVIEERRKYRKEFGDELFIEGSTTEGEIHMNNNKKRMAMLDLLLSAEKQGLIDAKGIQEEVDTFMFEGHDTTATGLTFVLMLLANHRDVQNKVAEELDRIFNGSDRSASMADLLEMKYLECCVKEGLRLYPPVHLISRRIGEDVQLQKYLVPAGALCHVHIYDLHRRGDLYSEPLQFRPDRFLIENCLERHPYAYIPFSAGPRNCIGQKFALLEMKSAISAILRKYEIHPITRPQDIIFKADLVLRTVDPVYVKFVKRP